MPRAPRKVKTSPADAAPAPAAPPAPAAFPAPGAGFPTFTPPAPPAPAAAPTTFPTFTPPAPTAPATTAAAPVQVPTFAPAAAAAAAHPSPSPAPAAAPCQADAKLDQVAGAVTALAQKLDAMEQAETNRGASIKKAFDDLAKAIATVASLEAKLEALLAATAAPAPQAPAATTPAPAAAAPVAQTAAPAPTALTQQQQMERVVAHIQGAVQQFYSQGGPAVNINDPNVASMCAMAALQCPDAVYLHGQDPSNPELQQHILDLLKATPGAVDPTGKLF